MDLDTLGAALKRKLGPLPVWIWAIVGGMIVYFLRSKGYFGGTGTQSGSALQPSQQPAGTPQAQTTLQPGESVYDPNTGTLTTAPGGGDGSGSGDVGGGGAPGDNTDVTDAIQALTDAVLNGRTDSESKNASTPTTHKPTAFSRAKAAVTRGRLGPKGRQTLKGKGYTDSQINFHLRRHTALGKPRAVGKKPAHAQKPGSSSKSKTVTPKAGTHTPSTSHKSTRARSNSHTKSQGRTVSKKPNTSATHTGKARAATATTRSTVRQRPTTAMVSRTTPVSHRPSSTHAVAQKKVAAAHAAAPTTHKPSSPPPRVVRTPKKKK